MEQNSAKYHYLAEQDSLYIETEKAESEILYRLCFTLQSYYKKVKCGKI